MPLFDDLLGTVGNIFQIGDRLSGIKTLRFNNGFSADVTANPTADRAIALPDYSGTLAILERLWNYPSIQRPINYTLQSSWASTFRDCYIGDAGGSTDGYFVGNMGGGAFFILLVFDIPETKTYNIEVRYAYGDSEITNNTIEVYNLTNGNNVNIAIVSDNNWGNYRTVQSTLTLNKGTNRVRIRRSGAQGFNTDYLRVWEDSYSNYTGVVRYWYPELLPITTTNIIPDLSKTPTASSKVFLIIDGQVQDAIAPGAAFTVTGKAIALTDDLGFNVAPGNRVIAFYETEE